MMARMTRIVHSIPSVYWCAREESNPRQEGVNLLLYH
jgi:hypothetical protein